MFQINIEREVYVSCRSWLAPRAGGHGSSMAGINLAPGCVALLPSDPGDGQIRPPTQYVPVNHTERLEY